MIWIACIFAACVLWMLLGILGMAIAMKADANRTDKPQVPDWDDFKVALSWGPLVLIVIIFGLMAEKGVFTIHPDKKK